MLDSLLSVAVMSVSAAIAGARVEVVRLGFSKLAQVKIRGVEVHVGPIPGGSVELAGFAGAEYDAPDSWWRLGRIARVLVMVVPWLVIALIAIACLGIERAQRSFIHAFGQLLVELDTTPLVHGFLDVARQESSAVVVGVVSAKFLAINLLPLPGSVLRNIVRELRIPPGVPPPKPQPQVLALIVGVLLFLHIAGRLLWGFVNALI